MYYVEIKRLNGRNDFYHLTRMMQERGYGDNVEYYQVEWSATTQDQILPHLRFLDEQDALAYCLTYGGTMSKTIPTLVTIED